MKEGSRAQCARVAVLAAALAVGAIPGIAVTNGPWTQHVLALGLLPLPDTLTMVHDRVAVVPAPGVLGNDLNLLGNSTAVLVSGPSHGVLILNSNGG